MTRDPSILQEVKNEILAVYSSLQGMPQVKAEIQYMKEIQMMDGYGMEYYTAKVPVMLQKIDSSCYLQQNTLPILPVLVENRNGFERNFTI